MSKYQITDNERRVLRAILWNSFHDQNPDTCSEARLISTWSSCVNDSLEPSGIEGRALAGVVTSLGQKGLVRVFAHDPGEHIVELTADGLAAARETEQAGVTILAERFASETYRDPDRDIL